MREKTVFDAEAPAPHVLVELVTSEVKGPPSPKYSRQSKRQSAILFRERKNRTICARILIWSQRKNWSGLFSRRIDRPA